MNRVLARKNWRRWLQEDRLRIREKALEFMRQLMSFQTPKATVLRSVIHKHPIKIREARAMYASIKAYRHH